MLDKEYVERGFAIQGQEQEYSLYGYIGSILHARTNRTGQHLFINKRSVVSPSVSFAVKEACGTIFPEDKYPSYVLHLELPSHLLDVNVHPQKKEVRFQEEAFLKDFIRKQVRNSLHPNFATVEVSDWKPSFSYSDLSGDLKFQEEEVSFSQFPSFQEELDVIGLFQHYLLIKEKEGILWIDLWTVQEKIAFDLIKEQHEGRFSQLFLVPITFELPSHEAKELETRLEEFVKMGFSISFIGKDNFSVEAAPSFLGEEDIFEVICSLLRNQEDSLKTVCRFARSCKRQFTLEEAIVIAKRGLQFSRSETAPFGKSMLALLEKDGIEKLFKV